MGSRIFSYQAFSLWNQQPLWVQQADTLSFNFDVGNNEEYCR